MAIKLTQRLAALCFGFGGGEVGDRLGLREVELAVEKRAPRKFAGLGKPQPEASQRRDQRRDDRAAGVDLKFGDVFAGGAARRGEPQYDRVIDRLAATGVAEPCIPCTAWGRQAAGQRAERLARQRAAYPDDRDSSAPRRGRRGENRICIGERRRAQLSASAAAGQAAASAARRARHS
jgi:hypothetical protein